MSEAVVAILVSSPRCLNNAVQAHELVDNNSHDSPLSLRATEFYDVFAMANSSVAREPEALQDLARREFEQLAGKQRPVFEEEPGSTPRRVAAFDPLTIAPRGFSQLRTGDEFVQSF